MRQQGRYADLSGSTYGGSQIQHLPDNRMEEKSGNFPRRPEILEGQWRWERERAAQIFTEGQGDATRSHYSGQRLDSKLALEKQSANVHRSQSHEEDMEIGYDDAPFSQTFEGLEQKFLDEIMKLAKEHADAEDAENARHIEKLKATNATYQEQLDALRGRHGKRRDEFLFQESQARKHQYEQQRAMDASKNDHQNYTSMAASGAYNTDSFETPYRGEQARFLGGVRDGNYEPTRGPYPGGRVYDTRSRYY